MPKDSAHAGILRLIFFSGTYCGQVFFLPRSYHQDVKRFVNQHRPAKTLIPDTGYCSISGGQPQGENPDKQNQMRKPSSSNVHSQSTWFR